MNCRFVVFEFNFTKLWTKEHGHFCFFSPFDVLGLSKVFAICLWFSTGLLVGTLDYKRRLLERYTGVAEQWRKVLLILDVTIDSYLVHPVLQL